jgi:hypothetical protein
MKRPREAARGALNKKITQDRVNAGTVHCVLFMRHAMRSLYCIITRTTWDITMLTCDVHTQPTQAIRSIFVADYTADELCVRAHRVFL